MLLHLLDERFLIITPTLIEQLSQSVVPKKYPPGFKFFAAVWTNLLACNWDSKLFKIHHVSEQER